MFNRQPLRSKLVEKAEELIYGQSREQELSSLPHDRIAQVSMRMQNGCSLAISVWPAFTYNPQWHLQGARSQGTISARDGRRLYVAFDAGSAVVPPMAFYTTFISMFSPLLVPAFPPGLAIDMRPRKMEGFIDLETGIVELDFDSEFVMVVGLPGRPLWSSTPLLVHTKLTTEQAFGEIFHACGERLRDGQAKLVGIARVPKTDDQFQNILLQLPTDALCSLNANFDFFTERRRTDE